MTRAQLGWAVPLGDWERFVTSVREEWGDSDTHVRFELERAMLEFMDRDHDLAEAERLLRDAVDVSRLSSSTAEALGRDVAGLEKRTVGYRIRETVKEEFKRFVAEECNGGHSGKFAGVTDSRTSYGEALAAALRAHTDGGRGRRVRDLAETLITGGSTGSGRTDETDESTSPADAGDLSTGPSRSTTAAEPAASVDLDAEVVIDIADDLPAEFPKSELRKAVAKRVNELETPTSSTDDPLELYCEAVTKHLGVIEHPRNDDLYIPEDRREDITTWEDLDKDARAKRLRALVAGDARREGKTRHSVTYRDVMDLFEENLDEGPSHDYAYTLMKEAADGVEGLQYTDAHGQTQLRVNLTAAPRDLLIRGCEHFADAEPPAQLATDGTETAETTKRAATDGGVPTSPTADD